MKNLTLSLVALLALLAIVPSYAQMSAHVEKGISTAPVVVSRVGRTDKEALRVIFLAGSTYDNFRMGMENQSKSHVNIEVTDETGAVVYTERMKKVYKRIKEMDFSFLKRGEYVVRVFNDDNEFSKTLRIP